MKMNNLIVIDCIEDGCKESDIIGVCSDMDNAIRIMYTYFGKNLIIYDKVDVRDSGIEYIYNVYCDDSSYRIVFRDFQLNSL